MSRQREAPRCHKLFACYYMYIKQFLAACDEGAIIEVEEVAAFEASLLVRRVAAHATPYSSQHPEAYMVL